MTGAKETAKLTGKETAARKPTEAKPKPKPKAKPKVDTKDDTKPKSKPKAKFKAKPKPNIPSVIESPLEHIDKLVDISKEIDIGKPDSEIIAEDFEATQTNDQTGDATEAILESAAETERLAGETEGLQAEDEQTGIVVEAEDSDVAASLSQDTVDTQTDKLTDDVSESVVEAYDTTESATEKEDDFHAYKQADDPTEVDVESSDTEILTEGLEVPQTDDQAGGVTEAILEAAAKTEKLAGEVEGLQSEDEQTGIVVEAEDSDVAASLSQDTVDTQTDKLTDDVSESVVEAYDTTESATEKEDDFHAYKQADDPTEVDVESSDTEILTEGLEVPQTDDQAGGVTEAILEAAAETERLADEAEGLQAEDEQADILIEAEDSDVAESLSQDAVDTQTDKLTDDVSESVVEDSVDIENSTENIDDTETDDQVGEVIEVATEAEKLAEEVEGLQTEDGQKDIIVEAEDSDTAESLIQEAEETQTDELTDDVSESVDSENPKEKIDDTKTDDQPGDVIEDPDTIKSSVEKTDDTLTDNQAVEAVSEKTVTEDSAAENKTVVDRIKTLVSGGSKTVADRIKKRLSGIFSIGRKSDDSTEEGIENHAEAESLTEGTDDIHTDVQEEKAVGTVAEDPASVEDFTESIDDALTDKQVGDADEGVDEDLDTIESSVEKADDTQIDNQVVYASEANIEGTDDGIQPAVYSDNKRSRTKKTGIIISVFIVTAAVILLIVASIERRSAKSALVQISKVAESIKQMQGEALKNREQVTHSQIESSELVIDSLLLTRNGLELERANSDEVEVKRIIDVFISDIDERITKIKGNIVLLKNKLKEAN